MAKIQQHAGRPFYECNTTCFPAQRDLNPPQVSLRKNFCADSLFKELRMPSTILNRVAENLNAAGCSRAILATVCGLKPSTLSAAYTGVVNLGHREADLLKASHSVLDAANALRPLPLPSDAASVAVLVNRLSDGTLTTDKIRDMVSNLFEVTQ